MRVERISAGGGTSFYNALAAVLMAFPRRDRPHLIFGFSDGLDNSSFLDASHIVALAAHSDASLYLALVAHPDLAGRTAVPTGPRMTPYAGGPNHSLLREAAARTGGAVYEKPGASLPALFGQVLEEFRSSYVLNYTPQAVTREGWHDLVVRTKDSRNVLRWRKGYDGG